MKEFNQISKDSVFLQKFKENFKNQIIDYILDDIRNANITSFFEKLHRLTRSDAIRSDFITNYIDDLVVLECRYKILSRDIDKGILSQNEADKTRTQILHACVNSTRLIEREIIATLQKNPKKYTEIEIVLKKIYEKNAAQKESALFKEIIEKELKIKIDPTYIKKGSILLGFKIPYDLAAMKKLMFKVHDLQISDFVSLKFNDPLLQSYFDNHNLDEFFHFHFKKESVVLSNIMSGNVRFQSTAKSIIDDIEISLSARHRLSKKFLWKAKEKRIAEILEEKKHSFDKKLKQISLDKAAFEADIIKLYIQQLGGGDINTADMIQLGFALNIFNENDKPLSIKNVNSIFTGKYVAASGSEDLRNLLIEILSYKK